MLKLRTQEVITKSILGLFSTTVVLLMLYSIYQEMNESQRVIMFIFGISEIGFTTLFFIKHKKYDFAKKYSLLFIIAIYSSCFFASTNTNLILKAVIICTIIVLFIFIIIKSTNNLLK